MINFSTWRWELVSVTLGKLHLHSRHRRLNNRGFGGQLLIKTNTVFSQCFVAVHSVFLHFSQAPGDVSGLKWGACHKNPRFQGDEKEKTCHFSQASDRGKANRIGKGFLSITCCFGKESVFQQLLSEYTSMLLLKNSASGQQRWQQQQHAPCLPFSNGSGARLHFCCSPSLQGH